MLALLEGAAIVDVSRVRVNILVYLIILLLGYNEYTCKIIRKFSFAKPLLHQITILI